MPRSSSRYRNRKSHVLVFPLLLLLCEYFFRAVCELDQVEGKGGSLRLGSPPPFFRREKRGEMDGLEAKPLPSWEPQLEMDLRERD
jgi:hypothetical protein